MKRAITLLMLLPLKILPQIPACPICVGTG